MYRLCSHMFPEDGGNVFCTETVLCEGMHSDQRTSPKWRWGLELKQKQAAGGF